MKKYLTIIFLLTTLQSYCQQTELVTNKFPYSKQISERFNVLKSDGTIKHGEYISYFRISEEEMQNVKNGIWTLEYFIKVKGNYENGKKNGDWIEYSSPETVKTQGKYIDNKKAGIWLTTKEHGQVVERFDYDKNLKLQPLFYLNISYPPMARDKGIEGTVVVSYKINTNCTVSNIQLVKGLCTDCDTVAINSIRKFAELLHQYGVACTDSIVNQDVKFVLR